MARINNFMTRDLVIRRPRKADDVKLITFGKYDAGDVVVPPGQSAEVDFWDEVKDHVVYQSMLSRRKISVGDDIPVAREHFTSAGDTLKAPARLDPEAMREEANREGVKNLSYDQEPAISTKRRSPGRPSKASVEGEGGEG